jgi:hypothetical protein
MPLIDADQLKAAHAAWALASAAYCQAARVMSEAQARRDRQASDAAYQQALDAHDNWHDRSQELCRLVGRLLEASQPLPQRSPGTDKEIGTMNHKQALALRQWIRDVNKLAERYGHEEMAGTPDDPDAEYVERFEAGETPAQVIAADFGVQQPTS